MYSELKSQEAESARPECLYNKCNNEVPNGMKKYGSDKCGGKVRKVKKSVNGLEYTRRRTIKPNIGRCLGIDCQEMVDRTQTGFCNDCGIKRDRNSGGWEPQVISGKGLEEIE